MSGLSASLRKRIHPGLELDATFEVAPGERLVIIGPSGVGKTSLLRLIAGLSRPDSGRITLDSTLLFDHAQGLNKPLRDRRIGMIYQDDRLFPHLDVTANIQFGLDRLPRAESDARVSELARACEVDQLLARRIETLSGGERQRVGLARALAPRPRLLLCDEPVSALDPAGRFTLLECLKTLQIAEGLPLIYVTHGIAEAVAMGDRLLLLRDGRIAAQGPPLEVLAQADLPGAAWEDSIVNSFRGEVLPSESKANECRVQIGGPDGPIVFVPRADHQVGTHCTLAVRADEILLARLDAGVLSQQLSARNVVAGRIESIIVHDDEAEISVVAGSTRWIASVMGSTVDRLHLAEGIEVVLVFKARSLRWHPSRPSL